MCNTSQLGETGKRTQQLILPKTKSRRKSLQEKNVNQPGFGDYLARIEIIICRFDKKNIVVSLCYSIKGKIFFFIFKFMFCLEIIMNQKSL